MPVCPATDRLLTISRSGRHDRQAMAGRGAQKLSITVQHTQESLCLAHIYAVAGMAGVDHALRNIHDYGVDGQFDPVIIRGNRRIVSGHPLAFQAKATINWDLVEGNIVYDLEAKTYHDMVSRTEVRNHYVAGAAVPAEGPSRMAHSDAVRDHDPELLLLGYPSRRSVRKCLLEADLHPCDKSSDT